MTEVLVEKVESNYTSNFWQGPCPNWLHLSWPPVWPTPHQTSKCMMVYHVLHVLLNLLFSTGKPRNVFLSVLRQETGFSRKDNSLTQTWVNPCWHCSWVCFDSKLDAAVLIVQWTKIWRGTNRLWTLDSSSYSNVPLTPSADENSTKLGAVHICPPQDKAATAYCLSWTKAQFKRMSENPEEYSTNQTEFLIAHFGWKDEERMICMFSQKKICYAEEEKWHLCVFSFLFLPLCLSWTKELWILSHLWEAEVRKIKGLICPLTFTFAFTRLIGALTFTFYFCSKQKTSLVPSSTVPCKLS